ncbi:hypothetical protein EPN52_08275 [bacterium]|nr:MAG: hypothetical protein EPN52_08275 [bacterium]
MVATLHHLALAVALRIHAQVLALQDGLLVLTSGDALRLDPALDPNVERQARPGRYVLIALDDQGVVRALRVADHPFSEGEAASAVPAALFVTPPHSATELTQAANVTVALTVQVPSSTPPGDSVYVATAASGWNANQVRCTQLDGITWRCAIPLPDGAALTYRYTRGAWSSVESDPAGGQAPARTLRARPGLSASDTVARWSDQR